MKFTIIFIIAFILRMIFACTYRGFETDTSCFFSWANMLWQNGFGSFYSPDYFCDYPPGYLYILWGLGGIMHILGLDTLNTGSLLIIKLPAILCDMAAGCLIFHFTKKFFSEKSALILSACYLFHPAVLTNSSLWGQVDSVFTLCILLTCILLSKGKHIPAYFIYAVSILIKPQALFFAPLILCAVAEYYFRTKSLKKTAGNLLGGLAAALSLPLFSLPFDLHNVWSQYIDTLSSYPYAAVNACNVWGLFGQNWISQDTKLGFLTYAQIGTLAIIAITLCSFMLFYRLKHREDRYYLTGAFLVVTMFLFSVRMHERYLFPAMILLLFAYIHNKDLGYLLHFWTLSLCHFGNVYYVLNYYDPANYDRRSFALLSLSFLTTISGFAFLYSLIRSAKGALSSFPASIYPQSNALPGKPQTSRKALPITRRDILIIIGISVFYGLFAFTNLGIREAPVTECAFPYNTYMELDAADGEEISEIYWYLLNEQDISCRLEIRETPNTEWEYVQDITLQSVFKWDCIALDKPASSIRLTNLTKDTNIGELVFTDISGRQIPMKQAEIYSPLFDEADTFPGSLSAQTGTYFDEIYYTRTVYEFLHGLPTYENTHPPFGKILITLGAVLFGTTPFGFRFMGALFGILMLPFMYLLGRNISRNRAVGAFCAFIFAFDFMHFAQTRLATIDVFITFFVIVMYFFMERYCSMSFYDTPLKKTWIPLGACGIAFGFGIASKWSGAYAGAGLAVLFFLQLFARYREYRFALKDPEGETGPMKHAYIIEHFKEYTAKTIGFCMVFFVAIPCVIYLLSYIPFVYPSNPGLLERMAANQVNMFNYHSKLEATHSYSSLWYEWPTMIRPIFYYSRELGGSMRMGISSFGNPFVWWTGIPAALCTAYLALFRRDRTASFLLIGYLAQYLPWTLIDRCTFIYHYFPSVPFVVLMIAYSLLQICSGFGGLTSKKLTAKSFYMLLAACSMIVFVLFLIFYPVLAGTPISTEYVDTYLRWMDSWVLVLN